MYARVPHMMVQFVLKIEKLSHIIGARESRDLRSPSPITAPGYMYFFPISRRLPRGDSGNVVTINGYFDLQFYSELCM